MYSNGFSSLNLGLSPKLGSVGSSGTLCSVPTVGESATGDGSPVCACVVDSDCDLAQEPPACGYTYQCQGGLCTSVSKADVKNSAGQSQASLCSQAGGRLELNQRTCSWECLCGLKPISPPSEYCEDNRVIATSCGQCSFTERCIGVRPGYVGCGSSQGDTPHGICVLSSAEFCNGDPLQGTACGCQDN